MRWRGSLAAQWVKNMRVQGLQLRREATVRQLTVMRAVFWDEKGGCSEAGVGEAEGTLNDCGTDGSALFCTSASASLNAVSEAGYREIRSDAPAPFTATEIAAHG